MGWQRSARVAQEKRAAEAAEAQLRSENARLRESIAALDARAPTELVEKVMARACFRATEEARLQVSWYSS